MALVAVGVVARVVAVALAEAAQPVAVVALRNLVSFRKGTANMGHYRTPVALHVEANRTPVPERRTQQANN